MEQRIEFLTSLCTASMRRLRSAPEDNLNIKMIRGKPVYYSRSAESGKQTFLHKEEVRLLKKLAQKSYDRKIVRAAEKELSLLRKLQDQYHPCSLKEIVSSFPRELTEMLTPVFLDDKAFAERWKAVSYSGKPFSEDNVTYDTISGIKVRSKSEAIILDALEKEQIPFRYEFPVILNGRRYYPDFTVLNVRTRTEFYWEHLGMMSSEEYANAAVSKLNSYMKAGIVPGKQLILTVESNNCPLDINVVKKCIDEYLR